MFSVVGCAFPPPSFSIEPGAPLYTVVDPMVIFLFLLFISHQVLCAPTVLDADTLFQNALQAQSLNTAFKSLDASDPCSTGQVACFGNSSAICVNGGWSLNPCSTGTKCFALPSVRAPGAILFCTSHRTAVSLINAAGAPGGVAIPQQQDPNFFTPPPSNNPSGNSLTNQSDQPNNAGAGSAPPPPPQAAPPPGNQDQQSPPSTVTVTVTSTFGSPPPPPPTQTVTLNQAQASNFLASLASDSDLSVSTISQPPLEVLAASPTPTPPCPKSR